MKLIIYWLSYANFVSFFLTLWDKRKAVKNQYRIPEKTFFILAFLGGVFGIELGMLLFHHKTKKASFFLIIHAAFLVWILFFIFIFI